LAHELAYGLYTICDRKGWVEEALAYNGLVVAWSEIQRLAGESQAAAQVQLI
jgi:putative DNA methylase